MPAKTFEDIIKAKEPTKPTGCGVLVLRDGKILTGTRIERASRGQICGPGGHIEPGETPEEAARRETMEEFNIECHDLKPLGVQNGGSRYGSSAIFLCTDYTGKPRTDEEEMTNPKWLTMRQIRALDAFPPFLDSLELVPDNTVRKFNPYHGPDGRFTHANGAHSFTYAPGKSKAHDLAIEREKKRQAAAGGATGDSGSNTSTEESKTPATGGHKPHMKGQELFDYTAKELGVSQQEAKDMIKEVSGYTDGYATDMRIWQQGGKQWDMQELTPKDAQRMSEQIEKYIDKSPKWDGGEIYRGIGVDEDTAHRMLDDIAFSGKPFDMKGTSSWSSDKSVADDFANWNGADVTIVFKAPGTKKGTSIDHISDFSQSEVLVSKDARWDVKRINGSIDDGYLEIEMEERP